MNAGRPTLSEKEAHLYAAIEERYPADESRFGVVRKALTSLPVIDLAPFTMGGGAEEKQSAAADLRQACIDIGFFYIKNHGLSLDDCTEAITWTRAFFNLPVEQKEKIATAGRPSFHGWAPVGGESIGDRSDIEGDIKEKYDMCRVMSDDDPMRALPLMGETPWPDEQVLPGFRAFMQHHMVKRYDVSIHVLHAFAVSLDLPETYFDAHFKFPLDNMRANYYPPVKPEDLHNNLYSAAPHTDYAGFTILLQDDRSGLEVRNVAGEWVPAPPIEGTFVVNVGDTMSIWTNDLYQSTPHRVRNFSGGARFSLPYFTGPSNENLIECLESCQGTGNPPRYAPTDFVEYLSNRLKGYYTPEASEKFKIMTKSKI